MNNKYNKFFENISPSAELERDTLNKMKKFTSKSRISYRRIITVAVAACTAAICGISAAAGGIIDVDSVFGNYIKVDDSRLAESLVDSVKDFKYKVSDSDYQVNIKGVAGGNRSIIAIAEISRVDGTPVSDHFLNQPKETDFSLSTLSDSTDIFSSIFDIGNGGESYYYINDDGNIEYYMDYDIDRQFSEYTIKIGGINFYSSKEYMDFLDENNICSVDSKGNYYLEGNKKPADIDDSEVKLIDLEWDISFKFDPSEKSLMTKKCIAPDKEAVLYQEIIFIGNDDDETDDKTETVENTVTVDEIEVSSIDGNIKLTKAANEYEINKAELNVIVKNSSENCNNIYIIKTDGTEIPASFGGYTGHFNDGGTISYDMQFCTNDENYRKVIVDVDDIAAISINGTVYELS